MSAVYLVRLGPPARGDTIHTSDCRFAQRPNALRWKWADSRGFKNIDWDALRRHGIRPCRVCVPETLPWPYLVEIEALLKANGRLA